MITAAFGAHGLEGRLAAGLITASQLGAFETGATQHLNHAIALVLVALALPAAAAPRALGAAAWCYLAGILLFSGSLYLYGVFGTGWLVMLTPLGGIAFIIGWGLLAYGLWPRRSSP